MKTGDIKASKIDILSQGPSLSLIELFNETKLCYSTKIFRLIVENNVTIYQNVKIPFFNNSSTFSLVKILEYCFSSEYDYSKYHVLYVKPETSNSVIATPASQVFKSDLRNVERVDIHLVKKVKDFDENQCFCFYQIADDLVSPCTVFKKDKLADVSASRKVLHTFNIW